MSAPAVNPLPSARFRWMRRGTPSVGTGTVAFIAGVIALCLALFVAVGNTWVAAIPLVLLLVVYLYLVMPIRVPLMLLVFLAALADWQAIELPNKVMYNPPVAPLTLLLFENLNKVLPVEALRFSFVDLLYVATTMLLLVRIAMHIRLDTADRKPGTMVLTLTVLAAFVAVMWLEVWGVVVRGGDFRQSLWQARQLFWLPTVTLLFGYALRDVKDFHRVLNLMIAAACLKIALAAWFMFRVARPMNFEPQAVTSHYDSILFTIAFVTLATRFVHRGTLRNLALFTAVGGWMLYGMVINNRRLAFVNLLVDLWLVYVMLNGPVKVAMRKIALYLIPVLVLYVAVGQTSNSRIFKPAKLITSVVVQKDRSSSTRDIENYNLLVTLKANKILGSGWGHEYIERVKADDISKLFAQYRFMAHNSILWLWGIGGLVGFTLIWMPISLGIFLARRAYLFVKTPSEKSAAALCVCILVTYMMQAWGDLGTQGIISTLSAAIALAMGAKLAVNSGAFPVRMRLFGVRVGDGPVTATATVPDTEA